MSIGRVPGATGIQPSIVDAKGDIIAATAADSVSRLAVGTNNQVLMADSAQATGLKYANEATATLTAKGDILTATAANTISRLGVGTDNYFLQAASGQSTGLQWGGAWTSYTPTYQNFTLGNGTVDAKYTRIGKMVFVYIKITLGSTSSVTGTWDFTLPFTSAHSSWLAPCYIQDAGTATYVGFLNSDSVRMALYLGKSDGTYLSYAGSSATVPMTWASGDFIQAYFNYEVA